MTNQHMRPANLAQTAIAGVTAEAARRLLAGWAPKLLRELYERDVRRPLCLPGLSGKLLSAWPTYAAS